MPTKKQSEKRCLHDYRVVDSVSAEAIQTGKSSKYSRWFSMGDEAGVKVLTVRRLKCSKEGCDSKRVTVEIFGYSFQHIIEQRDEQTATIARLKKQIRRLKASTDDEE